MICKYSLDINGLVYQFGSECIKNWDEISCELKRKEHGGTLSSFSSSFQFVGEAYNLLMKEYVASYLNSRAHISIYMLDNDLTYKHLYSARLDFGSLRLSDEALSLNSFDDSIETLLKTKGNTQYEFPVSEIKETQQLFYDRLQMSSETQWIDGGTIDENDSSISSIDLPATDGRKGMAFPLAIKSNEICVKNKLVPNDVLEYQYRENGVPNQTPFVNIYDDITVHLEIDFKAKAALKTKTESVRLNLTEKNRHIWIIETTPTAVRFSGDIVLKKGSSLTFDIVHYSNGNQNKITITEFKQFSVTFKAIDKPEMVDVIRPQILLNRLLQRIQDGTVMNGIIDSAGNARLEKAMIVAAESVRGIEGAKVYTSYKKFTQWMKVVFGYVPLVEGSNIRFVHRDTLFSDKEPVAVGKGINDVSLSVDNGQIYSSVKVGYDKKDYDSVNGRDEFRWSSEYETGINIKSSTLSLISPYRADAYGIEFLAAKRGEDTSDTNSDTDVFFVSASLSNGQYILDRDIQVTGVISPGTMFNAMYSPRSILKANERYIAATIDRLVFASSEGNSDVTIGGVKETSEYMLLNRLFSATRLKFKSASSIDCPFDTLMRVSSGGRIYEGYVDERSCKYGRYEGVDYKLLVKNIR